MVSRCLTVIVALTGSARKPAASTREETGASSGTRPSPARIPTSVEVKLLVTEWAQCRSAGAEPR